MSAAFEAGRLRHRVVLQSASGTADAGGGETVAWETFATVWAEIEPLKATEGEPADHAVARATFRITMRWRDDVAGGMRILHAGRVLRIAAAADPDETRRLLVVTAVEERP